ncbi:MAG: DUF480 domain-containing protein [Rudaea sp.]|nr:DUF480 domain-containing protein [Rudaea sp.]
MSDDATATEATAADLVVLTAIEARTLGCLIEKAATTPDVYPLTLNAVHLACNQKTNRDPVMNAEIGEVGHALRALEAKQLARVVHGARALRYEHTIDAALNLAPRARAVIALLLLRGAQTQAELHLRSERLADFPDVAILGDTLDRLIAREPPLVTRIGRGSGQREDRYMHLLSGPVSIENLPQRRADAAAGKSSSAELEARIEVLERLVAELQEKLGSGTPG